MKFQFGDVVDATNTHYGITAHDMLWVVIGNDFSPYITIVGYDTRKQPREKIEAMVLPLRKLIQEKASKLKGMPLDAIYQSLQHELILRKINPDWSLETYDVESEHFSLYMPVHVTNQGSKGMLKKLGDSF